MRTAITLAIHKCGELVEMLEGPLTPIDEQRARFKQARQSKTHPQFERIELWESDAGRILHHNFRDEVIEQKPQAEAPPITPPPTEPPPAEVTSDPIPEPPPAEAVEESGDESQGDFEVSRKPRKRK